MPASDKLMSGEKVLWKGRQEWGPFPFFRTILTASGGWFSIAFSVTWFGMANEVSEEQNVWVWFGLLPAIFGAYNVLQAFVETYILRGFTHYMLTNRRAIKTVNLFGQRQTSVLLGDIPELQLEQHRDGTTTIVFGRDETKGSGEDAKKSYAFRFRFVRDAARIVNAVEKLRKYKHHSMPEVTASSVEAGIAP